jgi:hypothetical protein
MKKILPILLLLFSTATFAQNWYIGITAGPTFSNYKTKTPWKEVSNVGYNFGVTAYKQTSANFGVNFGLQFIKKGYNHVICNSITDKLEASYLEVPIMADYSFIIPSLKNFKAHLNLGFYSAYWISGKYKMEGFDQPTENFDFKNSNASRFDIGPNGGGRIEYLLKNGSLSLDFRYELGLIDLQKQVNDDASNTNRAWVIGISYVKLVGK